VLAETGSGTTVHGYRDYSGVGSFGPTCYSGVSELRPPVQQLIGCWMIRTRILVSSFENLRSDRD
jgi:hypothetical protein